jgi:hypothetical protein
VRIAIFVSSIRFMSFASLLDLGFGDFVYLDVAPSISKLYSSSSVSVFIPGCPAIRLLTVATVIGSSRDKLSTTKSSLARVQRSSNALKRKHWT